MCEGDSEEGWVSDPARITLSKKRLRRLAPELRGVVGLFLGLLGWRRKVETQYDLFLREWDSRAALVLSTKPLLVAAYSDEFDASVVMKFPPWLIAEHRLSEGSRLLCIPVYDQEGEVAADIVAGAKQTGNWVNMLPLIAEFLSDDIERIEERKRQIDEEEWARCEAAAQTYLQHSGGRTRSGLPLDCNDPPAS